MTTTPPDGNIARGADSKCLLMFSGGRDSTLAAVRLAKIWENIVLVTVTSDHLVGYERVQSRLLELRTHLPATTRCVRVRQPDVLGVETLREATCLPCHREYVATGALLAKRYGIENLALGYVGYQDTWPEQTEYATSRLGKLLVRFGIRLHLPVHEVRTRDQAIDALVRLGISPDAWEQKCLQQQMNRQLSTAELEAEVDKWERSTNEQLSRTNEIALTIISDRNIGDLIQP